MSDFNFAYLDEETKRMIRRAILKAIAIPGYQVPFASREMPMPYDWGTVPGITRTVERTSSIERTSKSESLSTACWASSSWH